MESKQEYDALPYIEQLRFLMRKAQERHEIWSMLIIQDRIDEEQKN